MIASKRPQKTIVPWNFDEASRISLDRAIEITEVVESISVVHVAAPPAGPDNGMLYVAAKQRKCRDLEVRFRKQVKDVDRGRRIRFDVVYGNVGQEIARFAAQKRAELIVMKSRNRKAFLKRLFGSATDRVIRLAHCPVLAVSESGAPPVEYQPLNRGCQPAKL